MATTGFVLLVLAALVLLGRPRAPLTAEALGRAALRGVVVLARLDDRRRQRLRALADDGRPPAPTGASARPSRDDLVTCR